MRTHRLAQLISGIFFSLPALIVPSTGQTADYKPEYRLSTVLGDAFPWGWGGKRWAELVAELRTMTTN